MDVRLLHTRFWDDDFIIDLPSEGKLLFLYLIANKQVNLLSCFEISPRTISFHTGIDVNRIAELKEVFEASGKIRFHNNWIYLVNAKRYNRFTGEKNEIARIRQIERLPADVRDWLSSLGENVTTPEKTNGHAEVNEEEMIPARVASREFLRTLSEKEVEEIAAMTGRNEEGIRYQAAKCYDYLKAHGTRGVKDYQAYLTTWLTSEYNREDGPAPDLTPVFIKRSVS